MKKIIIVFTIILCAALMFAQTSTNSGVSQPFSVTVDGSRSKVGPHFYGDHHDLFKFGYNVVTNNTSEPLDVTVTPVYDGIPAGWLWSFCDAKYGACAWDSIVVTIPVGGTERFYATIMPNSPGYGKLALTFSAQHHSESFNHYFTTNTVDVLIIQDDNYERTEGPLVDAISALGRSYGVYKPAIGDMNLANIEHIVTIPNIIWNVSVKEPDFPVENLSTLGAIVMAAGTNLVVLGQYVAEFLAENDDLEAQMFLKDTLGAELAKSSTVNKTLFPIIHGHSWTFARDIMLSMDGMTSAYSINAINSHILFTQFLNDQTPEPTKGVFKPFIEGGVTFGSTIFLDFDFNHIVEANQQKLLIKEIFDWYKGYVSNDDVIVEIPTQSILSAFPNPVRSQLNIKFEPKCGLKSVETPSFSIFNIRGQMIFTGELDRSQDGFSSNIDVSNISLSSGVYFVRVNSSEETVVQRVMVLR